MTANEHRKDASSQVNGGEGSQGLTTSPEGWRSGKRKTWPPLTASHGTSFGTYAGKGKGMFWRMMLLRNST